MKKNQLFLLILIGTFLSTSCHSQDFHPYNKKFSDLKDWPITLPADVALKNFRPFRAVYSRTYTSFKAGDTVNDKVIMIAQRAFWYGKTVVLFEYQDQGTLEFEYTNGRTQFYYLDEKTLQLYLAVGPKAGQAEDYTTVRVLEDKISTSKLNTATGEVEFNELETQEPVFGFNQLRFLMWASMDLKVGDKIKLYPVFSPVSNKLLETAGIVEEQTDYTTPDGKNYRPYLIDNTYRFDSEVVNKFYIIHEPPYLLGQGLYNADDDEIYRWWLKLDSFEFLDDE